MRAVDEAAYGHKCCYGRPTRSRKTPANTRLPGCRRRSAISSGGGSPPRRAPRRASAPTPFGRQGRSFVAGRDPARERLRLGLRLRAPFERRGRASPSNEALGSGAQRGIFPHGSSAPAASDARRHWGFGSREHSRLTSAERPGYDPGPLRNCPVCKSGTVPAAKLSGHGGRPGERSRGSSGESVEDSVTRAGKDRASAACRGVSCVCP